MRLLFLALALVLLTSCALNLPTALMKNPQTGEVKECKPDPWGDVFLEKAVRKCVTLYEKAGWEEVK